jgi:Skp family chaperone for outer membrane proteins
MRFVIPACIATLLVGAAGVPAAAQDAPAAQASLPFPAGVKYGYIDLQRILAASTEGQAANTQVEEMTGQKLAEIEARNAALQGQIDMKNQQMQAAQQKLQQGETVMSTEARLALQREIARLQLEVQRDTQDAQAEMQRVTQDAETELADLQQQLQIEFDARLTPALELVATELGLDLLFNAGQGGLVWANSALDVTQAVVDRLNATAPAP